MNTAYAKPVFVAEGTRTPFIKAGNRPGPFHAADLALSASQDLMLRTGLDPELLDEVILGCVAPGPDEANIGRVLALRLGCGDRVPAMTVQRNCASGMQALDSAAQSIASGRADLILAGGTESMSHHPLLFNESMVIWLGMMNSARTLQARGKALVAFRPQMLKPIIGILRGLTDPVVGLSMGQTAEQLAHEFGISREQMDTYAIQSHQRLATATDAGYLDEIGPLYDSHGETYESDTGLRRDTSIEKLSRLRPTFDKPIGTVTAGNSAQVTDGAAMLLLASEKAVNKLNLPVIGRISDVQWSGLQPARMGLGPVFAMAPLLQRHELNSGDIEYWEINEAFAAQVLACLKAWTDHRFCRDELGMQQAFQPIDEQKLNIDGGGISLGHPVGASGARIVLHLLKSLQRRGGQRGIASLCIGGGQGGAMLVEAA
ncbi:MAG: acetyl-CoA C-acetyltransferase [bacterium]